MLTFMVRGIFSNLEFPYAQFPTTGAVGHTFFILVWDAVRNIEECGLKVMVIMCDGASTNRKMHRELTYKTLNPYSNERRDVFFMSDVPHLIKTTHNCWSNSFFHKCTRALWVSIIPIAIANNSIIIITRVEFSAQLRV